MKLRLSEAQFSEIEARLNLSEQTLQIARGVLVDGLRQTHFVKTLGLSKGAVSQAVHRVLSAAEDDLPDGYERVEAVLPTDKAQKVRQWSAAAKAVLAKQRVV